MGLSVGETDQDARSVCTLGERLDEIRGLHGASEDLNNWRQKTARSSRCPRQFCGFSVDGDRLHGATAMTTRDGPPWIGPLNYIVVHINDSGDCSSLQSRTLLYLRSRAKGFDFHAASAFRSHPTEKRVQHSFSLTPSLVTTKCLVASRFECCASASAQHTKNTGTPRLK